MKDSEDRVLYQFGGFRVDPQQRLLFAEGSAQPVPLPPRVFDTLLYFVERPGQLLSKQALMKAIWPTVVVEENSLNQNISMLRRALGENRKDHRFIVTAPKRGYRFVAPVRVIKAVTPAANADVVAGDVVSATGQAGQSVAVLPFANLTGDPSKEYFGEAIAAELIHTLSRVPHLKVPSRTSTFVYKGRNVDVRSIARELGVKLVLEGSIQSAAELVRVSAQLVDGETGYHIWSGSLERKFANLFELQDELTTEVAGALKIRPAQVRDAVPSRDLDAYHLYMQALSLSLRPTEENVRGAIELLRAALRRDPGFARALSLLAIQHITCVAFGFPAADALGEAEREAARALELDPADGATHSAAGVVDCLRGNWLQAEARFREAQTLIEDPLMSGWRCVYLTQSVGHLDRALQQAEEVFRTAPTHPIGARILAAVHLFAGRDTQALRYCEAAVDLGQSRAIAPLPEVYGQLALRTRRYADAAQYFIGALPPRLRAAGGVKAVELFCAALENPEQRDAANNALNEMEAALQPADLDMLMLKRLLVWRTMLGNLDAAYELLARTMDYYARSNTVGSAWGALWLPEMKPFRRDPRFQAFVTRLRLPEYWQEYGPPDGCELRGGTLLIGD